MPNILDSIQVSGASYDIKDKNAPSVSAVTQQEYDNLPSSAKTSNTFFVITDAEAGDLTNYYTKSETNTLLGGKADTATTYTKTEVDNAITAAVSGKQDTLISGTNIKTINNESLLGSGNIDIQGGGKAIEAGRGISITTGETADTVSFNLPISAGTGSNSIIEGFSTSAMSLGDHAEGKDTYAKGDGYPAHAEGDSTSAMSFASHAEGRGTKATGEVCHAEGKSTQANGDYSHAEGHGTKANSNYSHTEGYYTSATTVSNVSGIQTYQGYQSRHAEGCNTNANNASTHVEGYYTQANNFGEHASGVYNVSNSASTTFGDSGNTLFSVGNGTSNSARHNAFEIRQNGDIYLTLDGQDVKLQDNLGGGGSSYTAGDGIDITNDVISVTGKVDASTYNTYTAATDTAIAGKQATLVSGTNIKTINNESILGSGNIDIQSGSTYSGVSGITINNNNEIYYDGIYKTWLTSNHSNDYAVYWFRGKNAKIWISNSAPTSSYMDRLRPQFSFGGMNKMGNSAGSVAFGQGIEISGFYAASFGQYNYSKNQVEFSVGQYNISSSASTTFGDSGNTLFSIGNGTSTSARHNAFEIRQNGDIYLTLNGQDVKLQDQLGGSSITVDTALDSGSTNPVENRVIYNKIDEVEQVTAAGLNAVNDALGGLKLVKLTQTEYDNLSTKDSQTLYIVTDS